MTVSKTVWMALLLPLMLAGGRPAEARERLNGRLDEIRWRVKSYVAGGIMQPEEVAVIVELVGNEEWKEGKIKAGAQIPNHYTSGPSQKSRELRPNGRTYIAGSDIDIAIFSDSRLRKPRAFMVGKKKCFNFVGYVPPCEKKVTPPPAKKPKPVCVTLKVCKEVKDDLGSPANVSYKLRRETSPGSNNWEDVTTLTTNENGRVNKELREGGEYELVEQVPANYEVEQPPNGIFRFTVTPEDEVIVAKFVNRYCPPRPKANAVSVDVPRVQERPQYPILPQQRVQPGESVRQERIASLGIGGFSGGSGSRRTRCGRCGSATSCPHRRMVPPGNIPPGGQPPRDPTSGRPPTGGRPRGH